MKKVLYALWKLSNDVIDTLHFVIIFSLIQWSGIGALILAHMQFGERGVPLQAFAFGLALMPMCYKLGDLMADHVGDYVGNLWQFEKDIDVWQMYFAFANEHPEIAVEHHERFWGNRNYMIRQLNKMRKTAGLESIPVPDKTLFQKVLPFLVLGISAGIFALYLQLQLYLPLPARQ